MDQGENDFSTQVHRGNQFDKIPLPVSITDLIMSIDESGSEEKFKIGSYAFNTVSILQVYFIFRYMLCNQ